MGSVSVTTVVSFELVGAILVVALLIAPAATAYLLTDNFRILLVLACLAGSVAVAIGYAVASVLFFHVAINISMTIGLFPVIGIPLPFFSYGGSSLMGFSVLLFILIRLDAMRKAYL